MQGSRGNATALLKPAQAGAGWMQGLMGEMDDAAPGLGLAQRLVVGVELRV
eukprot:gene53404-71390_t